MQHKAAITIAAVLALTFASAPAHAEDSAARCKSLASQWDSAKVAKATSPNLGRAKAWARTGARDCGRDDASHRADGINEYIKALEILGVTAH